eukprot:SAG31_NODE_312_length_17856_cov_14.557827_1_plen_222_part_00
MVESAKAWPWKRKVRKAFFRGSRTTYQRDTLVKLARAKPNLAEAAYTGNQAMRSLDDTLGAAPMPEMKLEEHCKWKYLFNFRGMAASFRYKHLFLCRSLVFHVLGTNNTDFLEFFHSGLKPWVHYIPVKEDMSDMEDLLLFARENDDIAEKIAEAGYQFVKNNLRYVDVKVYWRQLLRQYAMLLRYDVKLALDVREVTVDQHRVVDKMLKLSPIKGRGKEL